MGFKSEQLVLVLCLAGLIVCHTTCTYVCASTASSDHVSFSLTHRDAESSPLRSIDADPADLPADMPLRAFVAAGRALRRRVNFMQSKLRGGAGGTPSQSLTLVLDTGSEIIYTQCYPCLNCTTSSSSKPHLFAYHRSSSFLPVPCNSALCLNTSFRSQQSPKCDTTTTHKHAHLCQFEVLYADKSFEKGVVSVDVFHLASALSRPFVFGCAQTGHSTTAEISSGVAGLDARPLSFASQLFASMPEGVPHKFAYCVPDILTNLNARGRIEFGNYKLPKKLRYTPLAPPDSNEGEEYYYYVKLLGISIGERRIKVEIGSAERVKLGGGSIFDSGTAITRFVKPLYDEVVQEMRRQTAHLRPFTNKSATEAEFDLCYKVAAAASKIPQVPRFIMHFAGGVDMEIGPESILIPDTIEGDDTNIYFCLAFKSIPAGDVNIIGNYQHQNYWVEYNLQTSSLGLAKAHCASYNT